MVEGTERVKRLGQRLSHAIELHHAHTAIPGRSCPVLELFITVIGTRDLNAEVARQYGLRHTERRPNGQEPRRFGLQSQFDHAHEARDKSLVVFPHAPDRDGPRSLLPQPGLMMINSLADQRFDPLRRRGLRRQRYDGVAPLSHASPMSRLYTSA